VTDRLDLAQIVVAKGVNATERASFGSVLFDFVLPNTRVRAASVAGTFTTRSPAATSCCDSK
jgi:hypothetical protein